MGGHAERAGLKCNANWTRPPPCILLMSHVEKFSKPAFAFQSLQALREWFCADERVLLKNVGACVKVYEVPKHHVVANSAQAVFNKRVANVVGTLDILNLS